MAITITSGPQIQDFKVRNAIDTVSTYLSQITEIISVAASPCSQVTFTSLAATGQSLASCVLSLQAVAQGVIDIRDALRTAKLMR